MRNFIKLYHVFKTESGEVWKIEPMFIPEEDVDQWLERGLYTRNGLKHMLGINIEE